MRNTIIKGKDINKIFLTNKIENTVLSNLNVELYEADFTVIMGPSGSGKSTLLYALSGMDSINYGEVLYQNKLVNALEEKQMAEYRSNDFGFVFQQSHLVSNLTLWENVLIAGYSSKQPKEEIKQRAFKLFQTMNIQKVMHQLPTEVSGGEAQRAAIIRAIIHNPKIIFADEPTGALNKHHSEEVLNILSNLHKNGQTILMVTHDVKAAIRATRILYLEDGKVLDEFKLPMYDAEDLKSREEKLSAWLTKLQW